MLAWVGTTKIYMPSFGIIQGVHLCPTTCRKSTLTLILVLQSSYLIHQSLPQLGQDPLPTSRTYFPAGSIEASPYNSNSSQQAAGLPGQELPFILGLGTSPFGYPPSHLPLQSLDIAGR